MWKYLPFVAKNLSRNRRRTTLTALSMAVSLLLLGILLSVYATFYARESYEEQPLRLITRHRISFLVPLPQYYGDRIRRVEGVAEVCIFHWFGGTYIDRRPEHLLPLLAVEPEKVFRVRTESILQPEQLEAFQRDRQGLALGKAVAQRLRLQLGDRIIVQGDVYPVDLELVVRAIYEGPDDLEAYFHWEYLQQSLPAGQRGEVSTFSVRLVAADEAGRVSRTIDEMFRNAPQPTKTETEKAFMLSFISMIGNIKLFLLSIATALVFTIVLVNANSVAMSVRERMREVAVLKTLGFSSRAVLLMIVSESLVVSLAGGLLGVGLCYLATLGLANQMVMYFQGDGYPVDSGSPNILWFGDFLGFSNRVNNHLVSRGIHGYRLLDEPIEEFAAAFGFAAVETEGELVQVVVQMFVAHGALMGAQQPALEQ